MRSAFDQNIEEVTFIRPTRWYFRCAWSETVPSIVAGIMVPAHRVRGARLTLIFLFQLDLKRNLI